MHFAPLCINRSISLLSTPPSGPIIRARLFILSFGTFAKTSFKVCLLSFSYATNIKSYCSSSLIISFTLIVCSIKGITFLLDCLAALSAILFHRTIFLSSFFTLAIENLISTGTILQAPSSVDFSIINSNLSALGKP